MQERSALTRTMLLKEVRVRVLTISSAMDTKRSQMMPRSTGSILLKASPSFEVDID